MGNCHDIIGTCLGYFYTGCSAIGFIYNVIYFVRHGTNENANYLEAISPMLFSALTTFISFLFVLAIEMRSPFLILPWLAFGILVCCVIMHYAWAAVNFLTMKNAIRSPFMLIIMLILVFAVAVVINSCVLLVKICRENKRSREAWSRLNRGTDNNALV